MNGYIAYFIQTRGEGAHGARKGKERTDWAGQLPWRLDPYDRVPVWLDVFRGSAAAATDPNVACKTV